MASFLYAVRYRPIKRILFTCTDQISEVTTVVTVVPIAIANNCFEFGVIRSLNPMYMGPALALLSNARLCQINWEALKTYGWFPYHFEYGTFLRIEASPLMIGGLLNGGEERVEEANAILPIYHEAYADRGMLKELS